MACDTCRKKKIRCDGASRCLNCVQAKEADCHYENRPPKKPRLNKAGRKSGKLIDFLNSRIERLENVILNLSDRLGETAGTQQQLKANIDESLSSESEDEISSSTRLSSEDEVSKPAKAERNPKQNELYLGTHSFISIMSSSSLQWIEDQLGPDLALMMPLRNIPILFQAKARLFLMKWIDPPNYDAEGKKKLLELPFPEDSASVFAVLDSYYTSILHMHAVGEVLRIRHLFERYYKPNRPKFRTPELLMMTIALLYSLVVETEHDLNLICSTPSSFHGQSSSTLHFNTWALQDQLLNYAVSYYYRLSVAGEGTETVEALLMFVSFLECNCISPQINSLILMPAIRFAYDLGLHRAETYVGLTHEAASHRRRLWWMCQHLDMEICFRGGKSPIINKSDVSAELLDTDDLDFWAVTPKLKNTMLHFYFSRIVRVRSLSYEKLFLGTANLDTFAILANNLNSLNADMFNTAAALPEEMRPVFFNDPNFRKHLADKQSREINETSLAVQLSFFSHMMVINRLPLLLSFPDGDTAKKTIYRNLSLNSARTVLELLKAYTRDNMSDSFYNWVTFFPLNAFLHLLAACMNYPHLPEAYNDLHLLIATSMEFFRRGYRNLDYNSKFEICTLVKIVFKAMLKIVIVIFENKTGVQILEGNEELIAHLDLPRKTFPELYSSRDAFKLLYIHYANVTGKLPFSTEPPMNNSPLTRNGSSVASPPQIHPTMSIMQGEPMSQPLYSDGLLAADTDNLYDDIDLLINTHVSQLPNFFFDSNLQF